MTKRNLINKIRYSVHEDFEGSQRDIERFFMSFNKKSLRNIAHDSRKNAVCFCYHYGWNEDIVLMPNGALERMG